MGRVGAALAILNADTGGMAVGHIVHYDAVIDGDIGTLIILTGVDGTTVSLIMVDVAVMDCDRTTGNADSATMTTQAEAVADLEVRDLDRTLERHVGDGILSAVDAPVLAVAIDDGEIIPTLLGEVGVPASGDGFVLVLVIENDRSIEQSTTLYPQFSKLGCIVKSCLEVIISSNIVDEVDPTGRAIGDVSLCRNNICPEIIDGLCVDPSDSGHIAIR